MTSSTDPNGPIPMEIDRIKGDGKKGKGKTKDSKGKSKGKDDRLKGKGKGGKPSGKDGKGKGLVRTTKVERARVPMRCVGHAANQDICREIVGE